MYTATKEFKRDMAHRLPTHEWKCFNVHWHTYKALITIEWEDLQTEWPETWMLRDFSNFKEIKEWIDTYRDHAYVWVKWDEVLDFLAEKWYRTYEMSTNPTAEEMAYKLYIISRLSLANDWQYQVKSVTVYETPTSFSTYSE